MNCWTASLLEKIEKAVEERHWTNDYSRNLVVTNVKQVGPVLYSDHTGSHVEFIWHAKIENHRSDAAAVNAVCVLDSIKFPNGEKRNSDDRSYLKWAYQKGYQRTILPEDHGLIDIFATRSNTNGIYLHSARDITKRQSILWDSGVYELYYKVFSEGFPLLSFGVRVNYQCSSPNGVTLENFTKAKLIN